MYSDDTDDQPGEDSFHGTSNTRRETDEDTSNPSSDSQRVRNVLTLEERVAVISQYDILPMYSKIARNFNCSWEQIKNIVSNRDSIMEFYEVTSKLSPKPIKDGDVRKNKLRFLGHCLYEYIQRAQYYLNTEITEELIRNRAQDFRDLLRLEGFVPSKSWMNHFKAKFNITLSNRQITITRRPPRSMNLRDIMSYCGRNNSVACTLAQRSPEPNSESSASSSQRDRPLYRTKTLVEASSQNQATCDEVLMRRRRKINFLEKCLYEYTERWQVHKQGRVDLDNLRTVAINLKDILKIENFFPDKKWLNHFKSHYGFNFSVGVPASNRRVPLSLDLRDIVSYCSRPDGQRVTLASKVAQTPVPTEDTNDGNKEKDEDDDDCVAVDVKPELIEIKDEDDDEDDNQILAKAAKRKMEDNTAPCPLKIQKIQSLHKSDLNDEVIPPAPSPGHYSETSEEANLPTCVENYKDALRLLKPLEEFVLLEENYRAIGLLTQLEQIFESMAKKEK
ncbi:uncharacterized protein Dana_GF24070 [Drosophila ananassae]|uniref:HTH CENPB-type domain-containing protein n=1 Tax=Drosophila ananassae TaxID=7217 RepID=B3MAE5_DROAN|nr:uncharacterized protein LOC6506705 isoform X2 [Drosophila ananassae]XP_032310173.1 uncharacterized protein LOC6506705 isoform X2 [Drosophila ananassae]EDV40196.2 uncharacterized protein Dana_GF24070 [Drosophila ananassae]